ncbi:MAG: Fur family transcriptional regulator [Victivallales bacterium]|nr:Fur family transcriptional regulator [Victivallales bacterium]
MADSRDLAKLRRYFASSGKRYTVEREHLLEVISEMKGRFTITELFEVVKAKGFIHAISTLYRSLYIFVDAGFITEIRLSGGRVVYETNTGDNAFLVCVGCGKLKKLELSDKFQSMQKAICGQHDIMPVAYNFYQKGYCSACRRKMAAMPEAFNFQADGYGIPGSDRLPEGQLL